MVLLKQFVRDPRPGIVVAGACCGAELDKIVIPLEILCKKDKMIEMAMAFQIKLAADDRFDVRILLGFMEEGRNAGHGAVIRNGKAWLAETAGLFEQVGDLCDPVNGIIRMYV